MSDDGMFFVYDFVVVPAAFSCPRLCKIKKLRQQVNGDVTPYMNPLTHQYLYGQGSSNIRSGLIWLVR